MEREFGSWYLLGKNRYPIYTPPRKLAFLGFSRAIRNFSDRSRFFRTLGIIQTVPGHSEWLTESRDDEFGIGLEFSGLGIFRTNPGISEWLTEHGAVEFGFSLD